jgi:hypothetical protein
MKLSLPNYVQDVQAVSAKQFRADPSFGDKSFKTFGTVGTFGTIGTITFAAARGAV